MTSILEIHREIKYLPKSTWLESKGRFQLSLTPRPVSLMVMPRCCSDGFRFPLTSDKVDSFCALIQFRVEVTMSVEVVFLY